MIILSVKIGLVVSSQFLKLVLARPNVVEVSAVSWSCSSTVSGSLWVPSCSKDATSNPGLSPLLSLSWRIVTTYMYGVRAPLARRFTYFLPFCRSRTTLNVQLSYTHTRLTAGLPGVCVARKYSK